MQVLSEEQRLELLSTEVERKIRGPKMEEITGDCRKLHKERLHFRY